MTMTRLPKAAVLAALIAAGGTGLTLAQTNDADPHHPATPAQATSPSDADDGTTGRGPGAMPGGTGMMGGRPMMAMHGHMMKIMFAVADADGDGALSFEEVTAIHKRIFDSVDANKDGKVTTEEIHAFMRP